MIRTALIAAFAIIGVLACIFEVRAYLHHTYATQCVEDESDVTIFNTFNGESAQRSVYEAMFKVRGGKSL